MAQSRHIAVISSLLVAGIAGAWWAGHTPQPSEAPAETISRTSETRVALRVEPSEPLTLAREEKQSLQTAKALRNTPSRAAHPTGKARADKTANNQPESNTAAAGDLKLDLPDLPDLPAVDGEIPASAAELVARQELPDAFDLTPENPPPPEVESITLFNPDYGLNGFLKQQWLSQRFGLQAGLGLNNDRLIPTDDGFRDDIAVGMGIILTF